MSKYTTVIPTSGSDGNIFAILGCAVALLKGLRDNDSEISDLTNRVMDASSYAEACDVIREWFPLEGDEDREIA